MTGNVREMIPFSLSYTPMDDSDQDKITTDTMFIEQTLQEYDVEADVEEINVHYFKHENADHNTLIVSQSDYNRVAKLYGQDSVELAGADIAVVLSHINVIVEDRDAVLEEAVTLVGGIKIQPTELVESTVFSEVD